MPRLILKLLSIFLLLIAVVVLLLYALSHKEIPSNIQYGMSFNTFYAEELGLEPNEVYDAMLDDLGVKHLRLAAHWPMIEPGKDRYDFTALDYQITRAEEVGADVVLAVGRRLPRWPECHVPTWARELEWSAQKEELRVYIEAVVMRYKDSPAVKYWQVENEPYLEVFAYDHCGQLDEEFLKEEIALVKRLDSSRQVLVTDSGNIGTWKGAYKNGDLFGTSIYVYLWNPELGQIRSLIPPWFYRSKEMVMRLIYGKKETMLIELSIEPWLIEPLVTVPIDVQFTRMDAKKFDEIIAYAKKTRYASQYLWGAEWWYWLREQGHTEMWEKGKDLYTGS